MPDRTPIQPLKAEALYRSCPPEAFTFKTTDQLDSLPLPWGQDRAMRALDFGSQMDNRGFNVFVLASPDTGALEQVRAFLEDRASHQPVPDDWCYLYNFDEPDCPRALRLPAGLGHRLRSDLHMLIDELGTGVPAVFESEEYQSRLNELQERFNAHQQQEFEKIGEEAARQDIALISTPTGFTLAPMKDGEVIEPDDYDKLSDEAREQIEAKVAELQKKLQQVVAQLPRLRKDARRQVRKLNEDMLQFALGGPLGELKQRWADHPEVLHHFDRIAEDVVENAQAFHGSHQSGPPEELVLRYRANLIVDHDEQTGAPVIYEDLPNHNHLVGSIEQQIRDGALVTDFSMIRAGALHRANGGSLVLDVRRVLSHPLAWESLKRVLASGEVRIESLERTYGLASTSTLTPEPIPVKLKVVLLGERRLFDLLSYYDPDFSRLFKVEADFSEVLERRDEDHEFLARLIATLGRRAEVRPLDAPAVARVLEHASRLAGDQRKLTAHDQVLVDLLLEADHYAAQAEADWISRSQIDQAIDARRDRVSRHRERALEQIERGIVLLDMQGAVVGQVNGLAVYRASRCEFGLPSRITATARPGKGQVIDIEREAKLGGSIHTKAVMILSRYIAQRYAADRELSLSASLAFEQSYGGVDGDSASVAEVCALLSALAQVGLKQNLAVTGSINQHGQVQAVGGVNEKIEGFFSVCRNAGQLGDAGVLLPASNVEHLMLEHEVVEAVRRGEFAIYPIRSVDEALALMVDLPLGEADAEGRYPADSFHGRVAARLEAFAKVARPGNGRSRSNGDTDNGSDDGS
ncbi:Lon protease family protein [Wenzhouxiangella marina]|uniref:endopeptidase La n=1 Tax=Wenzhouxiangella marina TaxID=1579979 RepID=A0A0K0XT72_9GAMM|nr:ATP-binding protein [Wenzhouxiangella marina]AKS40914.1 Peptidase S16, lon domain-containing protein [Wenzhouxiangella marina]MBB6087788.1 lon-related putative ATP-dependent protease [Wenzhouxiangella marina]